MSSFAIKISNLHKRYKVSSRNDESRTLIDALWNKIKGNNSLDFCALNNINIEINKGEIIGVIGSNGAGKSTLLKIISKITVPSEGEVVLDGTVSSLLEVGTGFHPELSGRENIFLNGSILGLRKRMIKEKFNEIVEFSGVEKFIDTPVKYYSSGMLVRLAFSVASCLHSDILLVDEVLAVGDIEFQKKSIGKMNELVKDNKKTVVLVSHNLSTIKELCTKCIWLDNGRVRKTGTTKEVVQAYINSTRDEQIITETSISKKINQLPKTDKFKLGYISFFQNNKKVFGDIVASEELNINLLYKISQKIFGFRLFVDIYDSEDKLLLRSFMNTEHQHEELIDIGEYESTLVIPANFFGPGKYELDIQAGIFNKEAMIPYRFLRIPVNIGEYIPAKYSLSSGQFSGKLIFPLKWYTKNK